MMTESRLPPLAFVAVGPRAVLIEVGDAITAADLAVHLRDSDLGAVDVVPAATTVLCDGVGDLAAVQAAAEAYRPREDQAEREIVEIPVAYDGPDLDEVATQWGTDVEGVVARHLATEFTAAFGGFAPGFAYLSGLPDDLAVSRLATPRTRVPAGSVALADTWCGIYPTASPGGWQLIGTSDADLWDVDRDPPALLRPGVRVRFVEAR